MGEGTSLGRGNRIDSYGWMGTVRPGAGGLNGEGEGRGGIWERTQGEPVKTKSHLKGHMKIYYNKSILKCTHI